ncbi:MAG: protein kinase domain-containing protein [Anaerolineales bacterium]|jgi:serine/threonine protein kinase
MSESIILGERYELEERIGSGGMAMVFRARDLMLERTVAIKTLRKDYSNDPNFRERFREEAKAAAKLSHPNIVTVHDFGLDSDRLYLVMEYVPGTDLKTLLKKDGGLTVERALPLITQACAGVGFAHRAGVVHCDVKPQNMLVTPDGLLKVVDFGIARALSAIKPDEKTKVVWGSPNYFSPEQASGAAPSPASDVYALGVVLYEMTTGYLPFKASNSQELAKLHREALPTPPRNFNPEISLEFEEVILKALSKNPSQRYRSAVQMGRVLVELGTQTKEKYMSPTEMLTHSNTTAQSVSTSRSTYHASTDTGAPLPNESDLDYSETNRYASSSSELQNIDWLTWIIGLTALIAFGGLIPFWLWVYYTLNPP